MHAIKCVAAPLFVASVVVPCLTVAAAAASEEIVTEVSVFPLKAVLQATGSGNPDNLPTTLLARARIDYVSWFVEHITPVDSTVATMLRGGQSHFPIEFVMAMAMEAFEFQSSLGPVRFEQTKCKLWDCYKDYLSLLDAHGRPVWRRRIPSFDAPVLPFEASGKLLFLAGKNARTMLYAIDLKTGQLYAPFAPEGGVSFEGVNFSLFFPYLVEGYVCAAEQLETMRDAETKEVVILGEPRVFVMKLRE